MLKKPSLELGFLLCIIYCANKKARNRELFGLLKIKQQLGNEF